jgi:glycosyltransferase involved in cell wall biosynthesis
MMGRFSEEKNHLMFLAAAKAVAAKFPSARFMIAGSGPLEKEIRAGAGEISFHGYMPVDKFFRDVDVYVMCSKIENLPYSILEAMAYERPMIATRVGGIPDLVEDQVTGRLIEAGDVAGLSAAMTEFVQHPDRIREMGIRGREKLSAEFSFSTSIEAHRRVYREVLPGILS